MCADLTHLNDKINYVSAYLQGGGDLGNRILSRPIRTLVTNNYGRNLLAAKQEHFISMTLKMSGVGFSVI